MLWVSGARRWSLVEAESEEKEDRGCRGSVWEVLLVGGVEEEEAHWCGRSRSGSKTGRRGGEPREGWRGGLKEGEMKGARSVSSSSDAKQRKGGGREENAPGGAG